MNEQDERTTELGSVEEFPRKFIAFTMPSEIRLVLFSLVDKLLIVRKQFR
jgi:hypothetical protein